MATVRDWKWSPLTGRSEPVGRAMGYTIYAHEHEDGTWGFNGFIFPTLTDARRSARASGY